MKYFNIILATSFLFFACKKEEFGPQCPSCQEEIVPATTDVLIGCEGNFGWGNASITKYSPNEHSVSQQVFLNTNGFAPGDVLQSFASWKDKLYVILNNSGKIEIIDTATYAHLGTITGLNSPRYMVTSGNLGYVSDLYSNGISVVNLSNNLVVDTIQVGRWSEHLLIHGDELYIGCPDTNWVLKYNLSNATFTDTIITGKSPSGIVATPNDHIWILSSGGYHQEVPKLIEYDGTTQIQSISFNSTSESPSQLRYNLKSNKLFYLNDGVYAFDLSQGSLSSTPVIDQSTAVFYGLDVDPNNSDIYVTDAVDYVQSGKVIRYDSLFNPIDTFNTGIIPQAIWFK